MGVMKGNYVCVFGSSFVVFKPDPICRLSLAVNVNNLISSAPTLLSIIFHLAWLLFFVCCLFASVVLTQMEMVRFFFVGLMIVAFVATRTALGGIDVGHTNLTDRLQYRKKRGLIFENGGIAKVSG